MSLEPVGEMMRSAAAGGYAVGYFESWNFESLQGAIDAAEHARSPIIIGFNGDFLSRPERIASERISWYGALGKAAAGAASVPCGLIFNECATDESVRVAVESGFNLVMPADASATYEDYVRRVAEIVEFAHARGVAVEGEIGELPCGSSGQVAGDGSATDPETAAAFVQRTGVDMLAVSVGNVHVRVRGEGGLDLERLAAIRRSVCVPLDLHGGTGISADSLREAVALGVTKVAYGTCLKQAYLAAVRKALATEQVNPHVLLGCGGDEDVMVASRLAVRDAVLQRMELLGCCGRA